MCDRRVLIVFDGFQCLYLSERSGYNYVFHISNMRNCITVCLAACVAINGFLWLEMFWFDWRSGRPGQSGLNCQFRNASFIRPPVTARLTHRTGGYLAQRSGWVQSKYWNKKHAQNTCGKIFWWIEIFSVPGQDRTTGLILSLIRSEHWPGSR